MSALNNSQFKDVLKIGRTNVDISHVTWPITVSVPSKFLDDHVNRSDFNATEHGEGRLPITWGSKMSRVTLHREHFHDLASDADYYAKPDTESADSYFKKRGGSAKSTLNALLGAVHHTEGSTK